jgi:sulfur-carrier protein adenylyltransferase/sulfurtransferase
VPGKTVQDLVAEAKAQITEITIPVLQDWLTERRDLTIIDVREPQEFQNGSIPGSVNIPRGLLELDIDTVLSNPEQPVLLYCGGGSRSALAGHTLKIMGYNNVHSLIGGYRAWQHALTQA